MKHYCRSAAKVFKAALLKGKIMNMLKKDKKIMAVCHGIGRGGAQRVTAMIANGLYDRGYQVRIVTLAPAESIFALRDGVEYFPIHAKQKYSFLRGCYRLAVLWKEIRAYDPDYILSLSAIPNMLTILANGFRKCKITVSERTDPSRHPDGILLKWLRNILYIIPKTIVFQTKTAANYFPGYIKKKGVIIPNAVMPHIPMADAGRKKKWIVGLGSYSEQKDWMTAVKAFELLIEDHPEYTFTIFGEGEQKTFIEDYMKNRTELKKRVSLPGFSDDVHEKIKEAAIFVSSARYDGISNSILEAMAMGLPCVCTDAPVGGAAFLIQNGKNGILVPTGGFEELYHGMKRVIEDHELQNTIRKNAVRVRKRFDFDKIILLWEKAVCCM